jgi:hypothetical protein
VVVERRVVVVLVVVVVVVWLEVVIKWRLNAKMTTKTKKTANDFSARFTD